CSRECLYGSLPACESDVGQAIAVKVSDHEERGGSQLEISQAGVAAILSVLHDQRSVVPNELHIDDIIDAVVIQIELGAGKSDRGSIWRTGLNKCGVSLVEIHRSSKRAVVHHYQIIDTVAIIIKREDRVRFL